MRQKMQLKTCLMAGAFALLATTAARADCANTNNPFDDVYCDIQVFHQADHQLNGDYAALKKLLNPAEQASLKQGEVAWIKDRNAQCTQSDNDYEFVAMDCAVSMTNTRDDFIKSRERECASTGCVDGELAKEKD
jgi:uncharacterized protein YecT (DUF1311 family)